MGDGTLDGAKATAVVGGSSIPPVVDLGEADEQKLVRSVVEASREWGFFQAVNHGVPAEVIAKLQGAGTEFFQLPQAEKEVYAKAASSSSVEGYGKKLMNKATWGEHLFNKIWPPSQVDYRFWPKKPECYREASEDYGRRVREAVAEKVFRCLSLGLGLEAHVLKESVGGDDMVHLMKINYYPPCDPTPTSDDDAVAAEQQYHLQLGVPAHTDMSSLTILVPNQVPGLQLLNDQDHDDRWIDVQYIPNALVFHIGDQIQVICLPLTPHENVAPM